MEAEPRSDHLQCTAICDLNIIAHRTGRITDKLKIHNASLKCKLFPCRSNRQVIIKLKNFVVVLTNNSNARLRFFSSLLHCLQILLSLATKHTRLTLFCCSYFSSTGTVFSIKVLNRFFIVSALSSTLPLVSPLLISLSSMTSSLHSKKRIKWHSTTCKQKKNDQMLSLSVARLSTKSPALSTELTSPMKTTSSTLFRAVRVKILRPELNRSSIGKRSVSCRMRHQPLSSALQLMGILFEVHVAQCE